MSRAAPFLLLSLLLAACEPRSGFDGLAGEAFAAGRAPVLQAPPPDTVPTVARRVWSGPETDWLVAPSPRGDSVALTDWMTGDMAIVDLATKDTLRLTDNAMPYDPGFGMFPRFSADGKKVVFGWWNRDKPLDWQLRVVPAAGGEATVLYPGTETPWIQPEDWSPDGRWVLAWRAQQDFTNQIVLVHAETGETRVLKTLDWRSPVRMNFSPDGRWIAYDFPPEEDSDIRDIFALATDGSREVKLVDSPANDYLLGWAPDGRLLFASDRTGTPSAWLVQVAEGRPVGDPVLVKPDMFQAVPVSFLADGSYMYGVQTGSRDVYVVPLDDASGAVAGPPVRAASRGLGGSNRPAWSPDGRHLAYFVQLGPNLVSNRNRIAIRSLETGEVREIVVSNRLGYLRRLQWLPDGGGLLLDARDEKGRDGLFKVDVQTGQTDPLLQKSGVFLSFMQLAPDGHTVVFNEEDRTGAPREEGRIVTHDLRTGEERVLFRMMEDADQQIRRMVVSPDGSRLAYVLWRPDDDNDLMLLPLSGGEPERIVSDRIQWPEWGPDGRHIYYARALDPDALESSHELMRVSVGGGEPESAGLTMPAMGDLAIHGGTHRLALVSGRPSAELWIMDGFLPASSAATAASGR